MLQELRDSLTAATRLVAEIGSRFRRGDSADELLATLAARIADIECFVAPLGPPLPDEVRDECARLLALIETATREGDGWLAGAIGPGLAAQDQTWRVRQAYGLPSRPD